MKAIKRSEVVQKSSWERQILALAISKAYEYYPDDSHKGVSGIGSTNVRLTPREEIYPLLASLVRALTNRQSRSINYRISGAKFHVLEDIDAKRNYALNQSDILIRSPAARSIGGSKEIGSH